MSGSAEGILLECQGGEGRVRLHLRVLRMGGDICVLLDGGNAPHVGAVALAGADGEICLPPLTLPGHREGDLAHTLAQSLARGLGCAVVVVCGIHIDNITRQEIMLAIETAEALAEEALHCLRENAPPALVLYGEA